MNRHALSTIAAMSVLGSMSTLRVVVDGDAVNRIAERRAKRVLVTDDRLPPDPGTMTRQRRRKAARQGKPVS